MRGGREHTWGRRGCNDRPLYPGGVEMAIQVETRNVSGKVTAIGSADSFTLVVDRPLTAGGGGLGFSGGQPLYLAVAACIFNDLFPEAAPLGLPPRKAAVTVFGEFFPAPP